MSKDDEVDKFVQNPRLLIGLCRRVVDLVEAGSDNANSSEQETQLREISRTIERLEKVRVQVPDALRAEKTRLAAAHGIQTESSRALSSLAEGLEEILKDLKVRLGKALSSSTPRKSKSKRSGSPKTHQKVYRDYIISALRKLGSRAKVADVLDEMERQLEGKLLPGDYELRQDGITIAWENSAQWQRLLMVKEGILRSDSPSGIWELTESHR